MKRTMLTMFVLLSCRLQAIPAANGAAISKPPPRQTTQGDRKADLGKEQGYL